MWKDSSRDKARLFQGADKWHFNHAQGDRQICTSDGPHGLRIEKKQEPGFAVSFKADAFPSAACAACSFDEKLLEEYGRLLGEEAAAAGVDLLLGPGINHKRSPLCGRNFEYFSEDPLLSGKLGAAYIRGVQSCHTGACLKHLAANSRERTRLTMNSVLDERTLRELYLRAFEIAVREGRPKAVMTAYNRLNGVHCCENRMLLQTVRNWGFDGLFISDWGAVSSPVDALKAGLNIEMPGGNIGADDMILQAVKNGQLTMKEVDENAERIHRWTSWFEKKKRTDYDRREHLQFIEKAAAESAVLLKNDGALPLAENAHIAVIGSFAQNMHDQGSGSARVNPLEMDSMTEALHDRNISFVFSPGYHRQGSMPDPQLEKEALEACEKSDEILFAASLGDEEEGEGRDRTSLALPFCQISLLHRLRKCGKKITVVLTCGSPVDMSWKDDADAILCMYYGGMRSSSAIVEILFGEQNPGGHLAETWPLRKEDVPCASWFSNSAQESQYRETIFSGYRYYTTFDVPCAFPFGFGLSFTQFETEHFHSICDNLKLVLEADVRNSGKYDGSMLVQAYASLPESQIARPCRQLIAFQKVFLKAGEQKHIRMNVPLDRLAYWDVSRHSWSLEEGTYDISLGEDAVHQIEHDKVFLKGNRRPFSRIEMSWFHLQEGSLKVSRSDFEKGMGYEPARQPSSAVTADTTLAQLRSRKIGRIICHIVELIMKVHPFPDANMDTVMEFPIRQMLWFGHGITWKTVESTVDMLNHPDFRKFVTILGSLKKEG